MITHFFNTSKPVHFVLIALFTLVVFSISNISAFNEGLNLDAILIETGKYCIVLASIFLLNFLVNKNKLSQKNGYEILIYSLLMATLPVTMHVAHVLLANFFILLALRRIISLKSNLHVKKKLFDAAVWITIASLFYFWAILFFILIVLALIFHAINDYKNWIIPIMGVITIGVITISYTILTNNSFGLLSDYLEGANFNLTNYNSFNFIYIISVLGILGLWALFVYIINIKQRPKTQRSSHLLILFSFFIGLTIVLIVPNKNGTEFLFIFPTLAIMMANYLESTKMRWLAEVFVWVLILAPISLLML